MNYLLKVALVTSLFLSLTPQRPIYASHLEQRTLSKRLENALNKKDIDPLIDLLPEKDGRRLASRYKTFLQAFPKAKWTIKEIKPLKDGRQSWEILITAQSKLQDDQYSISSKQVLGINTLEGRIINKEIISEETIIQKGKTPLKISLNIPEVVLTGTNYDLDIILPKTYFRLDAEGRQYDYTAALTVARMKFAVGLSSVIGFKVNSKGRHTPYEEYKGVGTTFADALVANGTGSGPEGNHTVLNCATTTSGSGTGMTVDVTMVGGVATAVTANTEGTGYAASDTVTIANTITLTSAAVTATIATVGQTEFPFNLDYSDSTDLNVKINGVKNTAFSITNDTNRDADKILTFTTAPDEDDDILLYTNNWYDIQPVQDANQYLADDVPLTEETVFTLPIHQRSENFNVRVFSNSPFPVSLITMMWEGQYSPRFYRRT